jgi:hypothetical protein
MVNEIIPFGKYKGGIAAAISTMPFSSSSVVPALARR